MWKGTASTPRAKVSRSLVTTCTWPTAPTSSPMGFRDGRARRVVRLGVAAAFLTVMLPASPAAAAGTPAIVAAPASRAATYATPITVVQPGDDLLFVNGELFA